MHGIIELNSALIISLLQLEVDGRSNQTSLSLFITNWHYLEIYHQNHFQPWFEGLKGLQIGESALSLQSTCIGATQDHDHCPLSTGQLPLCFAFVHLLLPFYNAWIKLILTTYIKTLCMTHFKGPLCRNRWKYSSSPTISCEMKSLQLADIVASDQPTKMWIPHLHWALDDRNSTSQHWSVNWESISKPQLHSSQHWSVNWESFSKPQLHSSQDWSVNWESSSKPQLHSTDECQMRVFLKMMATFKTHEPGIWAERIPDLSNLKTLVSARVFFRDCVWIILQYWRGQSNIPPNMYWQ